MIVSIAAWRKISSSDAWVGVVDIVFFDCPELYLMQKLLLERKQPSTLPCKPMTTSLDLGYPRPVLWEYPAHGHEIAYNETSCD